MADMAKVVILGRLEAEGDTEGYGALVHLTAFMGVEPGVLQPESDHERYEWDGHFKGLRSALPCVAMQEAKLTPSQAAEALHRHIADAVHDLIGPGETG